MLRKLRWHNAGRAGIDTLVKYVVDPVYSASFMALPLSPFVYRTHSEATRSLCYYCVCTCQIRQKAHLTDWILAAKP